MTLASHDDLSDHPESPSIDPEEFLARVRLLRQRINLPPLTDELLKQAREEGRL
jgi:hypothetical protein